MSVTNIRVRTTSAIDAPAWSRPLDVAQGLDGLRVGVAGRHHAAVRAGGVVPATWNTPHAHARE